MAAGAILIDFESNEPICFIRKGDGAGDIRRGDYIRCKNSSLRADTENSDISNEIITTRWFRVDNVVRDVLCNDDTSTKDVVTILYGLYVDKEKVSWTGIKDEDDSYAKFIDKLDGVENE